MHHFVAVIAGMQPNRIVLACRAAKDSGRDLMRHLKLPLSLNTDRLILVAPSTVKLTMYVTNP
jgi:hypothetical protein